MFSSPQLPAVRSTTSSKGWPSGNRARMSINSFGNRAVVLGVTIANMPQHHDAKCGAERVLRRQWLGVEYVETRARSPGVRRVLITRMPMVDAVRVRPWPMGPRCRPQWRRKAWRQAVAADTLSCPTGVSVGLESPAEAGGRGISGRCPVAATPSIRNSGPPGTQVSRLSCGTQRAGNTYARGESAVSNAMCCGHDAESSTKKRKFANDALRAHES